MATRLEKIMKVFSSSDFIDNLNSIELFNTICEWENRLDDQFFPMQDFNELMGSMTPYEIACSVTFGDFHATSDYFWFDGYGNVCSGDRTAYNTARDGIMEYAEENPEELYDYLERNFGFDILEDDEEEDEED